MLTCCVIQSSEAICRRQMLSIRLLKKNCKRRQGILRFFLWFAGHKSGTPWRRCDFQDIPGRPGWYHILYMLEPSLLTKKYYVNSTNSSLFQHQCLTNTKYILLIYFVLETNSNLFLSAGKLSGRSQLMHFRKMLIECLLVSIIYYCVLIFFGFQIQPTTDLVSNWSLPIG